MWRFLFVLVVMQLSARGGLAATINVTPSDGYAKIEAAQPGDEVVLAPGKYGFRVYLTQQASAASPIVIRAQDPQPPPVFDLSATLVENAPGSYTAGDRGRGCWQFSGASNYVVQGIVFTGCRTASNNSAGIRYYNGSTSIVVRDCVFRGNDDGLTGGTQQSEITVEFCEFDSNGNLQASSSAPTHNIYIYGGKFTLRYSYIHDPVQSQNFHIRASESLIESNWIARGKSYEGDLMPNDDFSGAGPFMQNMIFRGNLIVQGQPDNHGQIIALYNDAGLSNLTLSIVAVNNTVIAANPQAALVHLSNADGTKMSATLSNNILYQSKTAFTIETASAGTVSGQNNWLQTGTPVGALAGSILGSDPGLAQASGWRLAAGSSCIGAAAAVANLPVTEYYLDESTTRMYRVRASVHDLGAFESTTTGAGIGPYAGQPTPDASAVLADAGTGTADAAAVGPDVPPIRLDATGGRDAAANTGDTVAVVADAAAAGRDAPASTVDTAAGRDAPASTADAAAKVSGDAAAGRDAAANTADAAAVVADAGSLAGPDASASGDASAAAKSSAGCGCEVAGRGRGPWSVFLPTLLLAVLARRRSASAGLRR